MGTLSESYKSCLSSPCVTHVFSPTSTSRSRLHVWRSDHVEWPKCRR
ncbi:DEHA2B03608p [Debaryomyces hansenii CBS767]|uniref:DEHA2B03608p n=1 Tax=Debaryomyces hansenii (strain ATCC 36239 / CBS 767 / BCRC 21394 / JCM 1990 / NBRC 0083 / IGC 2968) TaxID=284592 RepID=Q6BXE8_DEBHA|nr:DEHA2B03608p [Debaryomyces hansenii CBS767]CAG85114.2 DEHA2B03608p [Debaryomyces hansenii CBS767]|eukprot:XP_457121.2 DEHA2B03608p [Debaryomyces hansenii CBS767]